MEICDIVLNRMGLLAYRENFNASTNSRLRITNSCHWMVSCFGHIFVLSMGKEFMMVQSS
jgi:hypothetical protein